MRAPLILLAFALIGCDSHITGPHKVVDPNAPANPVTPPPADTRPDLTIVLHAVVSDNSSTDAIVQLKWDVTATGTAQTINSIDMTVRRDAYLGYSGFFFSSLTAPGVIHGPNNAEGLTSPIRLPVGIYTFVATIDDLNAVSESNENNNTSTITVEVMPNGAG